MNRMAKVQGGLFLAIFTRRAFWALAVLLGGLALTALATRYEKIYARSTAENEFALVCDEVRLKVKARLGVHAQILRSGVAFFSHNNRLTRTEWRDFAERQLIATELPGIQGFGFALLIPRERLEEHTREIRAEGFPDYRIKPEGDREIYSSIIYLEPFADRNLRAFGYDMLSEPVRRAAMEQARDLDQATLSGKVGLVQETGQDVQAGTLMYAPVYRSGMPYATVAERRAAIFGWVYSPYRMDDLMRGIFGSLDRGQHRWLRLEVFDGETPSAEALLYDSRPDSHNNPAAGIPLTRRIPLDANGRQWLLSFTEGAGVNYSNFRLILVGGTVLTLLLSGLVLSLISTRLRAEGIAAGLTVELTETRDRLQKIIDSASEYIWELDADGTFTYASPRAADVLGRPVSRILDSKLFDLVPQEDRGPLQTVLKEHAEKQMPFENLRHRALLPDGSVIHQKLTGQPIIGADGKVSGFVGMALDITEEERAREQVTIDRERIETFFDVAIDLLCIFDAEAKFVRVSRAWEDLLGRPSKDIEGSAFMDNVHPDDLASTQAMKAAMEAGEPMLGFVNRCRSGTGEWRSIEWRGKLIRGNIFAAARDVTEAKTAERALEHALAQERETTELKSRLVSMASHEFRTPLATIRLAADILSGHRADLDEAGIQRALQTILSTTDFMTGIVSDVLELSSLGHMAEAEALSEIPLAEFLRQISPTPCADRITFEWDGAPVTCVGAPALLKRALNNLLDNAAKYSPDGSPIVLRLRRDDRSAIVQVEDQGRGIPPEEVHAALNEPFFRGSNTVGIPGTGLGLPLASEVLQRMGGKIEHSNRPGGGTIFTIHLPLAAAA